MSVLYDICYNKVINDKNFLRDCSALVQVALAEKELIEVFTKEQRSIFKKIL